MISDRHARWIAYLKDFTFVIRHKKGKDNAIADALSQRTHVLNIMKVQVLGFEQVKERYDECPDFRKIVELFEMGLSSNSAITHSWMDTSSSGRDCAFRVRL